jgi:hypothetical protein
VNGIGPTHLRLLDRGDRRAPARIGCRFILARRGVERGLATRRYVTKEISMFQTSKFILPYEPGYTGHWEAEKRRKETREWLRQREREIAAPSIVPEMPVRDATLTPKRG